MSLTVRYNGEQLANLENDGHVSLKTADKRCISDIDVEYEGGIQPSGMLGITANGSYDVTEYAEVAVAVIPNTQSIKFINHTNGMVTPRGIKIENGYIRQDSRGLSKNTSATLKCCAASGGILQQVVIQGASGVSISSVTGTGVTAVTMLSDSANNCNWAAVSYSEAATEITIS